MRPTRIRPTRIRPTRIRPTRIRLAAAMLRAAVPFAATSANAAGIGGVYMVAATNIDGSPHGGTALIDVTSDKTCEIRWTIGGSSSVGSCMADREVFAAGHVLNGRVGIVIYRVMAGGVLQGVWTIAGVPGTGTEMLKAQ